MSSKTRLLKYFFIFFFLFSILFAYVFINYGKWLDASAPPKKSDLIVCLGGKNPKRIDKTLELYNNGYSKKSAILITGDERTRNEKKLQQVEYRIKLLENKYPYTHYIEAINTKDEIIYIRNFMIKNNYQSAIIVSDKPHSRRINLLIKYIIANDTNLSFNIVSSKLDYWNPEYYYKDKEAQMYALSELMKTAYLIFYFEVLDRFGIAAYFDKELAKINNYIKRKFGYYSYHYRN